MKIGDLIRCGNRDVGILLRKLQYETDDESQNWNGESAWWIQFFLDDEGPMWSYEEELTLIKKGN